MPAPAPDDALDPPAPPAPELVVLAIGPVEVDELAVLREPDVELTSFPAPPAALAPASPPPSPVAGPEPPLCSAPMPLPALGMDDPPPPESEQLVRVPSEAMITGIASRDSIVRIILRGIAANVPAPRFRKAE